MYDGKCILRHDDTNPEDTRLEYIAAFRVGLEWLGIKYDEEKIHQTIWNCIMINAPR